MEGDLFGGSRGFTIFSRWGTTFHEPGNSVEHHVIRHGHYPENRSENKGNEPEGVEYGEYGDGFFKERFLFVGSERASVILVYRLRFFPFGEFVPEFVQVLPAGVAPEGLLAIPNRDLFVVACEDDAREDKIRSVIAIYERTSDDANYPTVVSANRSNGTPIPWGALSGLATGAASNAGLDGSHGDTDMVFAVHDSFYRKSRAYALDVSEVPAMIEDEIVLRDNRGDLADALQALKDQLPGTDDFDPTSLINDDNTVNLDLEGVAVRRNGGFWFVSEGSGNLNDGVSDPGDRPFESPNLLIRTNRNGRITLAATLPLEVARNQFRFGFEGVAVGPGNDAFVCFQRSWSNAGDPAGLVRIGRYDRQTGWTFAHYPLDAPESDFGGWVGLSELTYLGDGDFIVIERDNQGGPDAAVKRLYTFNIAGVDFKPAADVANFDVVSKTLVRDLLAEGDFDGTGGLILEKLEGLAVLGNGDVLIVNDNDGVDDSNGETQLFNLGDILD